MIESDTVFAGQGAIEQRRDRRPVPLVHAFKMAGQRHGEFRRVGAHDPVHAIRPLRRAIQCVDHETPAQREGLGPAHPTFALGQGLLGELLFAEIAQTDRAADDPLMRVLQRDECHEHRDLASGGAPDLGVQSLDAFAAERPGQ